jgi:hypothetical protein
VRYAGHKAVGMKSMAALGGDTVLVALNSIHADRAFLVFAGVTHFRSSNLCSRQIDILNYTLHLEIKKYFNFFY